MVHYWKTMALGARYIYVHSDRNTSWLIYSKEGNMGMKKVRGSCVTAKFCLIVTAHKIRSTADSESSEEVIELLKLNTFGIPDVPARTKLTIAQD